MPSSISSSDGALARTRLIAILCAVTGMIALGLGAWQAIALSPISSNRYLAVASDKVSMLAATKGEARRIVLIGGSGAAFSISAQSLTQELDRPVYNGGLQAGVGLRNLVDLYAPYLDPDNDLVVLLPEPEMLESDARYSQTWCDLVFLTKDLSALAARPRCTPFILWRTWQEAGHHMSGTTSVDPVYRRSGFNARGDLTAHLGVKSPTPDFSAYDHPQITPERLQAVIDHARATLARRGVEVLYVPAAMPKAGCIQSPERVAAMVDQLSTLTTSRAEAPKMDQFCLAPPLFFDGAGHLNERGRVIQTENVRRAIADHMRRGGADKDGHNERDGAGELGRDTTALEPHSRASEGLSP